MAADAAMENGVPTASGTMSVLHRKAATGQPAPDEFAMTPAKALGQAMARVGQALKMPVGIQSLADARMTLGELTDVLEDRALLAIVEGPEAGLGLVALSPALLSALIEMQTTGRVNVQEAAPRRPTRTDAAMTAGIIDMILREVEDALDGLHDRTWAYGFRYASFLADPRPLSLLLEETRYRVFRTTLNLAEGTRMADFLLALPADGRAPPPHPANDPRKADTTGWENALTRTVLAAPAQMDAVLHKVTMTLAEVMTLQSGQVIEIPADRLSQVRLEIAGSPVTTGRLGQLRGYRAIRLDLGGADRRLSGLAKDAENPVLSAGGRSAAAFVDPVAENDPRLTRNADHATSTLEEISARP